MEPAPLNPVLVVDDEPNDLLLFRRAAKKSLLANPIRAVEDGEDAIAFLDELKDARQGDDRVPAVIILDLKMPKKNGFDVLAWIREQPGLRRIPVVVFTSSSQDPDIARAYDLGANSYLVKPVTFESLIEMVRTLGLYWTVHNEMPSVED